MLRCSLQGCSAAREPRSTFCMAHQVGSYRTAHRRVERAKGRAAEHDCVDCGGPALEWSYVYGDPNEKQHAYGPYSLNPAFYEARCRACHRVFDARNLTPV